jgi:hypothetical protein
MKPQTEPFTEFAKLGRGVPKLAYVQNRKTAHVYWGDGSMRDYHEFRTALDNDDMSRDLHEAFRRAVKEGTITNNRPALSYSRVHGHLAYGPIPFAIEIREIVRGHFTRALEKVAALGDALDDPNKRLKEACE